MKRAWYSCDGSGHKPHGLLNSEPELTLESSLTPTRRQVLLGSLLSLVSWASSSPTSLAEVAVQAKTGGQQGDIIVSVFLRGGADGLSIVVPHGDDDYYKNRPSLSIPAPGKGTSPADRALDLDGFFGLHPSLSAIHPFYKEGSLALVHAVGSGDTTRSHFEAMNMMERGLPGDLTGIASGWLARHLNSTQTGNTSPLRAVAFSNIMPAALRGATPSTALDSLADFRLALPTFGPPAMPDRKPEGPMPAGKPYNEISREKQAPASAKVTERYDHELKRALEDIYSGGKDAVYEAGRETLKVLDTLNRIDPANYQAANGAVYPTTDLGNGFKQVACLVKGNVGLEVACLDRGGWDSHFAQGRGIAGGLAQEIKDLGDSIAAFVRDMGPSMKRITIVVQTEFGRTVHENNALGTDHGRASMMMVLGGGTRGGKVYSKWPGLKKEQLVEERDLKVTTDYRDVLSEVLIKRANNKTISEVFPEHNPSPIGIVG